MNGTPENKVLTPQKPVNLLPEVPSQTSRKLSDREQHDCDVIGKWNFNIVALFGILLIHVFCDELIGMKMRLDLET